MKKTLGQILAVSSIFDRLTSKHYANFSVSYKLAKAAKELNAQRDFYTTEERKIVETYAIKDKDGNVKILEGNRISFKDQKDAIAFNSEINNLHNTEVDIFEPITIPLNAFKEGEMDLTPNEINALDGFVIFDLTEEAAEVIN